MKRQDIAAVGRSGWADSGGGRCVFLTLTAPGVDVLPFDRELCNHSPEVSCSGAIGCRVSAVAAAVWHDALPLRWSHFVTELRRTLNPGLTGSPSSWPVRVEFFKTYEPQRRDALHVHAMLRVEGPVTWRRFVAAASKARRLNGFGAQMNVQSIAVGDAERAARTAGYCAKYASKNADALPSTRRIDPTTGEVRYGGLRAWSASRRWGTTMRAVHGRRRAFAARSAHDLRMGSGQAPAAVSTPLDSYRDFYADPLPPDGARVAIVPECESK